KSRVAASRRWWRRRSGRGRLRTPRALACAPGEETLRIWPNYPRTPPNTEETSTTAQECTLTSLCGRNLAAASDRHNWTYVETPKDRVSSETNCETVRAVSGGGD